MVTCKHYIIKLSHYYFFYFCQVFIIICIILSFFGCNKQSSFIYIQSQANKIFFEQNLQNTKFENRFLKNDFVFGVAVPHHLLASNLSVQTLMQLKDFHYKNIFILSPDHFSNGNTKITIADKNFETVFGLAKNNQNIVNSLKKIKNIELNNDIFFIEHGIGSVLPFAQSIFKDSNFIPILIRSDAKENDLNELIYFLEKEIKNKETLIIQSSDFSHYLTKIEADKKDKETIDVLLSASSNKIWSLNQPDNCDSINILYIMKKMQEDFNTNFDIYTHKNSQDYTKDFVAETTSYITYFLE
jgi:poly-gamma-glutamate synthesis protein (capsule biosynthesis protein)